jgi:hypothetical protein
MICSGFAFHSWLMPRAPEKCITAAKARKVSKVAELTDLYGDRESKDCSLDHTASVALPYLR